MEGICYRFTPFMGYRDWFRITACKEGSRPEADRGYTGMKRLYLNLKIAMRSLLIFKLRSALAILGVFLGTFSLVIVSNLSDSLSKKTEKEAENLGKNLLIVRSGVVRRFGTTTRLLREATTLVVEDSKAILQGFTFIIDV